MSSFSRILVLALVIWLALQFSGCSNPQPGPDKSAAGMILGAGWGAGAGAIVGNQIDRSGQGVAVGAGFGALSGLASGAAYDLNESAILDNEEALASMKIQNAATAQSLSNLQAKLDRAVSNEARASIYQVFFDPDATSLRAGATSNLEVIAESLKSDPAAYLINVVGHADDSGSPKYNERLAEARARSVSAYLASRGVSMSQIQVKSFGSKRPLATNSTETGRQLNRRVDIFINNQG